MLGLCFCRADILPLVSIVAKLFRNVLYVVSIYAVYCVYFCLEGIKNKIDKTKQIR